MAALAQAIVGGEAPQWKYMSGKSRGWCRRGLFSAADPSSSSVLSLLAKIAPRHCLTVMRTSLLLDVVVPAL